ncbi:MAG: tetratricopeptide repeat protein [Bryobacteraceae bacterium]
MKRSWQKAGLAAALLLAGAAYAADLTQAENLYKRTDFEGSLKLLNKRSSDAAEIFLVGRNYFMRGDFKKAGDFIQKAATLAPTNSEYMDWLGRTYGKRAETGNIFAAPGYASKARQAFEKAVELDPKNNDALSDLFDYYLEAPGFLGGGYEKAAAVADKLSAIDPAEAYFERAKLAQKKKEYQSAETHMRQAIAVAPHEVGHLIALARLLATQGKERESDAVFLEAEKVNPNAPQVWFARADILIKQKRSLNEAKLLLEKYMSASITVDDPPKGEARRLLKQAGGV